MLWTRWNVRYKTPAGQRIVCTGLLREGVETIARAQIGLGATEVEVERRDRRPDEDVEIWGQDVNGRACIVAKRGGGPWTTTSASGA